MTPILPAATTLIIRESTEVGIEVLLLKRNSKLVFAPGFWVFPGGRIDAADGAIDEEHLGTTAKVAAAREAYEEARICVNPEDMTHFCHWTTPVGGKRRFATWFFHCLASESTEEVQVDNGEIVEHKWISPIKALAALSNKNLPLLPPTYITLQRIKHAKSYKDVTEEFNRTGIVTAAPITKVIDKKFYCLYNGDSGYDTGDISKKDAQHRLIIDQEKGHYQFEYHDCSEPPINGGVEFY
ncbi:MAG: 8-oxo-dGTP pyrophosphatase MutT (NUDIX family) [Saprospiraceae bacterium]|jgi:8-oxo-dGTP pyrophosphatase MutT (NUDIX family)